MVVMSDMAKSFDSLEYNVKYIGVLVVHLISDLVIIRMLNNL